jgi:hypothetical protein
MGVSRDRRGCVVARHRRVVRQEWRVAALHRHVVRSERRAATLHRHSGEARSKATTCQLCAAGDVGARRLADSSAERSWSVGRRSGIAGTRRTESVGLAALNLYSFAPPVSWHVKDRVNILQSGCKKHHRVAAPDTRQLNQPTATQRLCNRRVRGAIVRCWSTGSATYHGRHGHSPSRLSCARSIRD